jgi:hypothetical protein
MSDFCNFFNLSTLWGSAVCMDVMTQRKYSEPLSLGGGGSLDLDEFNAVGDFFIEGKICIFFTKGNKGLGINR